MKTLMLFKFINVFDFVKEIITVFKLFQDIIDNGT